MKNGYKQYLNTKNEQNIYTKKCMTVKVHKCSSELFNYKRSLKNIDERTNMTEFSKYPRYHSTRTSAHIREYMHIYLYGYMYAYTCT